MDAAIEGNAELAVLDLDVIESLQALEMFEELAGIFLQDLSERLREILAALRQGGRNELTDAAHSLKGSSAAVGAIRLGSLCMELQHRLGEVVEQDAELVCRIETEARLAQEALQRHLSGLSGPGVVGAQYEGEKR
jgi:HPt (histidine-containing phosphotransfer) domain-containing protein